MQQKRKNNIEIKITENKGLEKEQIQNCGQQIQIDSRLKDQNPQGKIQQNKSQINNSFEENNDEKLKQQFFQQPNIQSIIQDSIQMFNKCSKDFNKKYSEHTKKYLEFFSAFEFENSKNSQQLIKTEQRKHDNLQNSDKVPQKIRIKSKDQIKNILFQKGIYIQSISQRLSKKNEKILQNIQNSNKQKKVRRQINQKKLSQLYKTKSLKIEEDNDSQEIEDGEQGIQKWHYLQENLTSQYHVQNLLKTINSHEQLQSNEAQQSVNRDNQFSFIQQEFHQPQPQINSREQQEEKNLNFKILQIRSTFSPQAFDIICSVGQIYIIRISLLINMRNSEIHKHIIYSQGSYGNIYLLNGKISTQNQAQEFVPYQVKQNNTQSYSEFKNLNHEQINDLNKINKDFFVVKCFKLRDNQNFNELLHSVLKQYSINCIMSALEIGPKVVRKFGFDLMVYPDCIEYCLQFCQNKKPFQEGKSQIDLKTALLTMHQINLIHLDIKPQNIAFSRYFNKWIFLDFGFSDFILENLGEKTFICYVGTYQYSSSEMKKALTSDSYVDLYYNDVYALKRSFIFMQKYEEIVSGNNSSIYYNHTFSLLLSVQINQNFIKQALITTRLKYFLLRQDLKKSCIYLKYLLKITNNDEKNQIKKAYQIKNARKKIKKQVQQLFPLLMRQPDSDFIGLSTIDQQKQEDWTNFQKSNLNFKNDQYINYQKVNKDCFNTEVSSKLAKSAKKQVIRFYKSLLLTDFYVDFYYEHISYLIDDSILHKQIQKKIKSNLIHNLVRFQSMEHQESAILRNIKSKLFYRELKSQINQFQSQDQQQDNINFDKLYALSLSINHNQYEQALLAKRSIIHQNQGIVYWNQRAKARKGIINLKQKLLDRKFLDNLSQQQYFNLYYRYVTFKKYIYKAKLQDKLAVSDFFIKYWKIDHRQYCDFTKFFQEFITNDDIKDIPSNQTVTYSQKDTSNIKQTQQDQIERKNYKKKIVKNLQKTSPLYSLIICFRYIIVNCIYIQPSNNQKKQLFISLICQYFLIDDTIFTCQNDFNFLIAWYKIIIYHHCFFKNQDQKMKYLLQFNKQEDIEKLKKQTKTNQNFFQLMQKLWRLNQADRILHYRIKPIKIKYIEAADFKNCIQFILKDRKNLRNHFSSQVSMEKFLKIITIENFIHFHERSKEFTQCFILEQDLKIIKSQILKNKSTNDRTKIYLIKLISLQLFAYDTFIQETAKVSQIISKQKEFVLTQKLFQDIDFKTILKDEIVLLKSSQFHYKENKVISNAKRIILQLASTPFSYKQIEQFHFHLTQRLRTQGKIFESQSILKLIDRTINCKEISSNFLTSERRYFNYYIEKDQKKTVDLYQKSVNFFNPYQTFSNVDWIDDLITFSSIFVTQQSYRVNKKMRGILTTKQRIQYTQKNQQFVAYKKFLYVQQIFVQKLKKYIKTVVLSLNSNMNSVSRTDYNNFFAILRQSLFYLKTQPPKSNLTSLTSQNFFATYEAKKSFFYQIFQKSLPFCQKYMNKISRNPIVRRYVYSISDQVKQFSKQFQLVKLEARSIRYFQQRKYLKTMGLIYQNLEQLGVRHYLKSQTVKLRMEHVRTLLLYVKAFFVHYQLKDHCWYEKYNYPEFVNLKIAYTKQELVQFIKKEGNLIDQSEKKYEIAYKQILKILYLFFVSTGDFLVAMQFNAPSLQFLIQTAKNVGDQKSYFQICLYLVSLSRFMSKNSLFKFTTYTIGNIEEFANKNVSPITKPLFEYLIKFTQKILLHNYEQFSNQSKEWKNPHWWIFVNIFLKFSQINCPLLKKILLKIAFVIQYLNSKLRQQITPLFYVNYVRFRDLQCFKGQISIKKLKNELLKLHKYQLKHNQNKINIHHYIRLLVKSFCGMEPIIYHFQPRNNHQIPQARNRYNMKSKDFFIEDIQSDRVYFLSMRFQGFNRQMNSFYPLDTNYLNSQRKKERDQEKNQNYFSQTEQKAQSQFRKRHNLVRKPSISRSQKQDDKKQQTQSKPQLFNLSVSFNYEFKRKVQQIYCKLNGMQNFIQSQPQISLMKCKIIHIIIQKIYTKQKNIENVQFQSNIQKSLVQKKSRKTQDSQKNYVFRLDDLPQFP